jgi:hypothetical protein
MSTYGRNFEFRVQPHQGQRRARYFIGGDDAIPFGAPVVVDTDAGPDVGDRLPLVLAEGDTEPIQGLAGIALYEHAGEAFIGTDTRLTTFSDIDTAPAGGGSLSTPGVYLVSGTQVKIVLRNTEDRSFFGQRDYVGRTMIDGVNAATPSVEVGDFLRPHDTPSDTDVYWQVATGGEDAWLVVTAVDSARNEVEATFLF